MSHKRIIIIGPCGSGKSTLSVKLGEKLRLPVTHLDRLFWREGWQIVSKEEFDRKLHEEMEEKEWIIEGNFDRTIPDRLNYCDCVIYLDYSRVLCTFRVLKRIAQNYGKVRPDMGDGCPERLDPKFLIWTWNFNKNHRAKTYEMLKEGAGEKELYIFRKRKETRAFLETVSSP